MLVEYSYKNFSMFIINWAQGAAKYSNGVALATSKIIILFVLVCIFHV
jgi:hypothetical protein